MSSEKKIPAPVNQPPPPSAPPLPPLAGSSIKNTAKNSRTETTVPINVSTVPPPRDSEVLRRRRNSKTGRIGSVESDVSTAKISRGALFCKWLSHVLHRVFAFPLVSEPICFHRAGIEPLDEAEEVKARRVRKKVEEMVNFDSDATKQIYAQILERRKEVLATKNKYHSADIDVTKYPGWDEASVGRLKIMFQIFDISEDGLIDFEETCTVLSEFGDKTPLDVRKRIFFRVQNNEFGSIGFEQFIEIVYNLTMKAVDPSEKPLSDIFKKIENNVSIRSKLDVLGQLQGGLF